MDEVIVMRCDHCGNMWMGSSVAKKFPRFGTCYCCFEQMRELTAPVPSLAQLAVLSPTKLLRIAIMAIARSRDALDRVDKYFEAGASQTAMILDIARERLKDGVIAHYSELEVVTRHLIMYTHMAKDVQAQAVGHALISMCIGLSHGVFLNIETVQEIIRQALFSQNFDQFHTERALMDATNLVRSDNDAEAQFDAFIAHASEDKDEIVRPLVTALNNLDLHVWYDENQPQFGDSDPHPIIVHGLTLSAVGVVVLSHRFLAKTWPRFELEYLLADQAEFKKPVLIVSHGLTELDVRKYSPQIAKRGWFDVTAQGVERTAQELATAIREVESKH